MCRETQSSQQCSEQLFPEAQHSESKYSQPKNSQLYEIEHHGIFLRQEASNQTSWSSG
jgi:hypothetical protein